MKLDGKILVVAAMMLGSMAAVTGCNAPADEGSNAVAPEESAATAPVENEEQKAGVEQNHLRFRYGAHHYYAPHGPPAARREVYGRAPSARHFWAPGYYRWDGRQHLWVAGRWEVRRHGYEYVAPHWERRYGRWEYIPGYWARR